jgi:heme-degrading monooxygenase HmoA
MLTDASTNKIVVITRWETEAHLKAGVNNGFVQQQVAKIAPLLNGVPTSDFYEVDYQG